MKTDDLIRALAADLPTKTVAVRDVLWRSLPLAAVVMAVGWFALAGLRGDLLTTGLFPSLYKVALGSLMALVSFWTAIKLARPDQGAAPSVLLLVVPAFALLAIAVELAVQGTGNWSARLWGHSFRPCLSIIPALALLPLAGSLYAFRNGAARHPSLVGALSGVGSGGIAILAYGLFCTEDSALFIGTWYLLASAIAGLIGAIAGRFVLRW
jgi:hypothetical protein